MRYLGLDLGTKTLGISISDRTGMIATSLKTIKHDMDFDLLIEEIIKLINEYKVEKIVLGFPKNMNNSVGEKGEMIISFKDLLSTKVNTPIVLEDERLTTRIAQSILISADVSRKKRKKVIDKMAANVILQSYLDKEGNKRNEWSKN